MEYILIWSLILVVSMMVLLIYKMNIKTTLKLIVMSLFLTGCGGNPFSILDDENSNETQSPLDKYLVTREVTLEELEGTWKIIEKSKDEYLKGIRGIYSFYVTEKEKKYRKNLDERYLTVKKSGISKFKIITEYEGEGRILHYKGEENRFLYITYRKEDSWGDKTYYCLEIEGVFYLGRKYSDGDYDSGNLEWYYMLYKKVK